jgi:ABC-type uncharacterized transport system permease subunit
MPNRTEILFLLAAGVLLVVSVAASMARRRAAAALTGWLGVIVGIAVLALHAMERGDWFPLQDNFDALAALGVMLAACVLYVQSTRPVGGLDWFVLPVAVALLVAAAIFGEAMPRQYGQTAWSITHRLTAYGGALALTIAGAMGGLYLVASRRLRAKQPSTGAALGSLERLETISHLAMVLGWSLFTVGLVTGLLWGIYLAAQGGGDRNEFFGPKVYLAVGVWIVYALALHTVNPSFRGRKAAVLSLIGLVLMAGTLVAVQFMPGVKH